MASSSVSMPSSIEEGKPPIKIIINVPLIIAWSFKDICKCNCFVIEEKKISIATVAQVEHEMTGWLQSLNPIKFAHELCFPLLHYSFTVLFLSCPFNISGTFLACAYMLGCFSHVWLFVTLWTVARQAPLSMGFSRQEHWSGLSCLPPGDLPGLETEAGSPSLLAILYHWATGETLPCMVWLQSLLISDFLVRVPSGISFAVRLWR